MIEIFINYLPYNIRESFFWRFLSKRAGSRLSLYKKKDLVFGKKVKMNLSPNDICHQIIAHTGFFELHLSKIISNLAKKGGIFVDIGANYGYYSLIWASMLRTNKVHSIEAFPPTFEALKKNIHLNNLQSQITCHNSAISKTNETMFWDLKDANQNTWAGLSNNKNSGEKIITHSLDTIFEDNIEIFLLKVDVEGAESFVFEGAKRLLSSGCIKNIAFEKNVEREKDLDISPDRSISILENHGYTVKNLNPNQDGVSEYFANLK